MQALWKRSRESQDIGERAHLAQVAQAVRLGLGEAAAAALAADGAALNDEGAAALLL